jgi:hypothetical protein
VEEPFFQQWVFRPDEETETFWKSWLLHHPHQQAVVEQAALLMRVLASDKDGSSPQEKGEVWERIQEANEVHAQRGARERKALPLWSSTATPPCTTAPTGTGIRELWLNGMAYFKVTHTPNHRRFVVHTDGLQVEVLGTEFNVFNRCEQVKVLLSSGKVRLRGEPQEGRAVESVLAPGELAIFSRQGGTLATKKIQHLEEYVAWKEKILVFRETPLREIAQKLRDLHGFDVKFAAPELGELTFAGIGDANDFEPLLQKISRAFGLKA